MMKKVLLVGSSYSAAPVLMRLKQRDLHVSVCGKLKDDPCHHYADTSHFIDYSDKSQLLDLVESEDFDFLVPTCNDYSYVSCAFIAEQYGFPGFDTGTTSHILHNKSAFRDFTEAHKLPAPRLVRQKAGQPVDLERMNFPLLVKPVDSFSGRGVTKVHLPQDLQPAIDEALGSSRASEAVIEEFVEGSLHSHSAYVRSQEIVFDAFVDEYCTVYPYQVNCSNHPSRLSESQMELFRAAMLRLIKALQISDGLLHTQFIINDDRFWIIECMRRCPGDLYSRLIELSTGVDYLELFVRPFLNEELPVNLRPTKQKYIGRHTISSPKPLFYYAYSENLPTKAVSTVALKYSGEELQPAPYDKLAIVFTEYQNRSDMLDITPRMDDYFSILSLEEYLQ